MDAYLFLQEIFWRTFLMNMPPCHQSNNNLGIDHVCNNTGYNFKNIFNEDIENEPDLYTNIRHSCNYLSIEKFHNNYSNVKDQISFLYLHFLLNYTVDIVISRVESIANIKTCRIGLPLKHNLC